MECIRWKQELQSRSECGTAALLSKVMEEGLLSKPSFTGAYAKMSSVFFDNCKDAAVCQRFMSSYRRDLGLDLDASWKEPYREHFAFMESCMQKQDLVPNRYGVIFPFRSRSLHMERVAAWVYRCSLDLPQRERDLLVTAAILHDVGYSVDTDGITHAHSGIPIVRSYLKSRMMPEGDIDHICDIIQRHSDKTCLKCPDNDPDFQLLIEADHIDETGAMSIVWDILASMTVPEPSVANTLNHISRYSMKMLQEFPMKTSYASRIWQEKQKLVLDFYTSVQADPK